ncbi:hypothetical protein MRB53_021011 [Persea americana]|uniref:Uncharacterized protein n=1 Tax=Persea americana TaxID=3435 RepID=A0ACC2L3T9_PERAE|nr:hypothetical protein MRB53_021011 [Persea americana]
MMKRVKKRRERATRNVVEPKRDEPKKQKKVAKDKTVSQSDDFVNINEQMQHKATTKSDKKKPFKLLKNSITKPLNEADKKMLKLIYDTDGYKYVDNMYYSGKLSLTL